MGDQRGVSLRHATPWYLWLTELKYNCCLSLDLVGLHLAYTGKARGGRQKPVRLLYRGRAGKDQHVAEDFRTGAGGGAWNSCVEGALSHSSFSRFLLSLITEPQLQACSLRCCFLCEKPINISYISTAVVYISNDISALTLGVLCSLLGTLCLGLFGGRHEPYRSAGLLRDGSRCHQEGMGAPSYYECPRQPIQLCIYVGGTSVLPYRTFNP